MGLLPDNCRSNRRVCDFNGSPFLPEKVPKKPDKGHKQFAVSTQDKLFWRGYLDDEKIERRARLEQGARLSRTC